MMEPLDYEPQQSPLPNHGNLGFFGCLIGLALFAVAFYERLTGSGSRELTGFLLAYCWLLPLDKLPFSLVLVMTIIQLPLEGGIIGFLIERRRATIAYCVIASHLAAAAIVHLR